MQLAPGRSRQKNQCAIFSRGNPGKRSACIGLAYSTPSTSARLRTRTDRLQAIVVDPSGTLPEIGDSVLARRRVPQLPLLERVDAVVCHAGHNTVCETLWHGLPLVVAPIRDDQPAVAGQVTRAGAGVRVRFNRAGAAHINAALDAVLHDPDYRAAAQRVGRSFREAGGATAAATHLEQLAARTTGETRPR